MDGAASARLDGGTDDVGDGTARLLSAAEEIALAQRIEAGLPCRKQPRWARLEGPITPDAHRALDTLIMRNTRLVFTVAVRWQGRGLELDDLIQEGNIGLMTAAMRYDWRRGTKFSTYAMWWIRQAISKATMNTGHAIRRPIHAWEAAWRVEQYRSRMLVAEGREPTRAEIMRNAGVTADTLDAPDAPLSLDAMTANDSEMALAETLEAPDMGGARHAYNDVIANALDLLPPRERQVIALRFGFDGYEPHTLEETAAVCAAGTGARRLTRERIRQIEEAAILHLRLNLDRDATGSVGLRNGVQCQHELIGATVAEITPIRTQAQAVRERATDEFLMGMTTLAEYVRTRAANPDPPPPVQRKTTERPASPVSPAKTNTGNASRSQSKPEQQNSSASRPSSPLSQVAQPALLLDAGAATATASPPRPPHTRKHNMRVQRPSRG